MTVSMWDGPYGKILTKKKPILLQDYCLLSANRNWIFVSTNLYSSQLHTYPFEDCCLMRKQKDKKKNPQNY